MQKVKEKVKEKGQVLAEEMIKRKVEKVKTSRKAVEATP
jgi:hypothetical protein